MSTPGAEPVAADAESPVAVVRRFNAAWAAHDLAAALVLTSDDCVFESTAPPDGQRCASRADIRAAWQPIFENLASTFIVEETIEAGPRVVQRWRYDWADGHVRGVDIFTVKDGQITEKAAYVKG